MPKNVLMIKWYPQKRGQHLLQECGIGTVSGCGVEGGAKYVVGSQLVFSQEDVIRHLNITFWKGKLELRKALEEFVWESDRTC